MDIQYEEINDVIFERIIVLYGEWLKSCIRNDDTFALAALDGDTPIAYVCVTPRALTYPLEHAKEAYIKVLGVHPNYRRNGIGRNLIACAEEWARKEGFKQIRTHSDKDSPEAIKMWNALNYTLCPVDDWIAQESRYYPGYYVAKVLTAP